MVFSTYRFIFMFLPVVFAGYYFLNKLKIDKLSKSWLVLASLFFYGQGNIRFLPLFVGTVLFNYIISISIIKTKESNKVWIPKLLLGIGLFENLGLLGYYKYSNFFLENVNRVLKTKIALLDIALPLGISFFTFQIIALIVDSYRGDAQKYSLLDYLVFITFFPRLIVGPIVHHSEIPEQLEKKETYKFNPDNFILGIFIFSIGCAKKILIADPLIDYAQQFYANAHVGGFFEAWTAVFSYTFAYYFDFSGYGDMAVGLGFLFNIRLPFNFNSPYKARNFNDFWKRWNITLTQFLNDYVFKSIYKFGNRAGKLFFAVFVTFVVSGIWHGAGWHFIFWGVVNSIFVGFSYIMILKSKKMPFPLAWGLTFAGVILTRVLFDSQNLSQAIHVFKSMLSIPHSLSSLRSFASTGIQFFNDNLYTLILILLSGIICFAARNTMEMAEEFKPNWKNAAFAAILLTVSLFEMTRVSNFLYFRF